MDDARHRQFTGVSNALILENLQALSARGTRIAHAHPRHPRRQRRRRERAPVGRLRPALPRLNGVELLPYHRIASDKYARLEPPYTLPEVQPPSEARMAEIAQLLRQWGLPVKLGG